MKTIINRNRFAVFIMGIVLIWGLMLNMENAYASDDELASYGDLTVYDRESAAAGDANTLVYDFAAGIWYKVENGLVDTTFTNDVVSYNGSWFYIKNGVLDWSYTGLVNHNGSWFYVSSGVLDWSYTGLTCYDGSWFYVSGGVLDWSYTGLACYNDCWFYISGGVLDWSYTGLCEYVGALFYIAGGCLKPDYSGTCTWRGNQYIVRNGTAYADVQKAEVSDVTGSGYEVTVTFTAPVAGVFFATWTRKNGQDDLVWHSAEISENTASFYVPTFLHKFESGNYITQVYLYDAAGNQMICSTLYITVPEEEEDETEAYAVIMGDSRTVGMYFAQFPVCSDANFWRYRWNPISDTNLVNRNGVVFAAKGGEAYRWWTEEGIPSVQDLFTPGMKVIICFGANDPYNAQLYAEELNMLCSQYPLVQFYMCTVGYCSKARADVNAEIDVFNDVMRTQLDSKITLIDVNTYVEAGMEEGTFGYLDSHHYTCTTCRGIYSCIMASIQ